MRDTKDASTQRKCHVSTQREGSHLQTKEGASGEANSADPLILDFQFPEL